MSNNEDLPFEMLLGTKAFVSCPLPANTILTTCIPDQSIVNGAITIELPLPQQQFIPNLPILAAHCHIRSVAFNMEFN